MSAEKKTASRRRKASPDVPFYIALALCVVGIAFSAFNSRLEDAIACILIAITFTAIRFLVKGAWRAARSLIFFVFASVLGAVIISGAVGLSLAFAFILLPFLILAFWLFFVG